MTDYTNDRWHVDGPNVTHDDFPGAAWGLMDQGNTKFLAAHRTHVAASHAARAWLAAQPKPTIKVGMRIEATLREGAVVIGKVTSVIDCVNFTTVYIGPGIACYTDSEVDPDDDSDVTDWHEVTA